MRECEKKTLKVGQVVNRRKIISFITSCGNNHHFRVECIDCGRIKVMNQDGIKKYICKCHSSFWIKEYRKQRVKRA